MKMQRQHNGLLRLDSISNSSKCSTQVARKQKTVEDEIGSPVISPELLSLLLLLIQQTFLQVEGWFLKMTWDQERGLTNYY